jgi:predicted PhzF superfamily epimerase YddE/YHI9
LNLELTVVDAFTDRPFCGNPAAVAVVDRFPQDQVMQAVAMEMNLSETAFVKPRPDGGYDLRWFTPAVEVDLCGHATLAAAWVLGGSASFSTRSGTLGAIRMPDGRIELDFPADPPEPVSPTDWPGGLEAISVWRGRTDLMVELPHAEAVRTLEPDLAELAKLPYRAVIFTAPSDQPGLDCTSRVFCPAVGVPEDPVTGSAHCLLGVFWGQKLGKATLVGEQASARRGLVGMRWEADRMHLAGSAVGVSKVTMDLSRT